MKPVRFRRSARARRPPRIRLSAFETLEGRLCLALPYGAMPDDTGEFMIGDVYVTVVLLESNGAIDPNTENWTASQKNVVKSRVASAVDWWEEVFDLQNSVHDLNFTVDYTYADNPAPTGYEPIGRPSYDMEDTIYEFLDGVGVANTGDITHDIRTFNHNQRVAHDTHWAFTLFVVNNDADADGLFAPGGFYQSFAYAGGQFLVTLADRPTSAFAHEIGHMFWAMDEYGGLSYTARRGYYNTQNWNADDNPAPDAGAPSIMLSHEQAFVSRQISTSAKEMLGWRDSDGDGIFDVLDVPLALDGVGHYDAEAQGYRFSGASRVQTLPNRNSSGWQNDITTNRISRVEYRIDGGAWQAGPAYDAYEANIELFIPLAAGSHALEIRTIDLDSGVTSNVFAGDTIEPSQTLAAGIGGYVWHDRNFDSGWDSSETRLAGWTVRLIDANGNPLDLASGVEPDDYAQGAVLNTVNPRVTLTAISNGIGSDSSVTARDRPFASTGGKVLHHLIPGQGWSSVWTAASRQLKMAFTAPVTSVSIDAVSNSDFDYGRLEIYNSSNELLGRTTSAALATGEFETLTLNRPTADIAYAIARGHGGSAVQFDNLRFGPESSTVTDASGAWSLPMLGGGEFHAQIVAHPDWDVSPAATHTIDVAAGQAIDRLAFGVSLDGSTFPLHHADLPADIEDDGDVTNADAMKILSFLRANPRGMLVAHLPHEPASPWLLYDASGDNVISNLDAMIVASAVRKNAGMFFADAAPNGSTQDRGDARDDSGEVNTEAHGDSDDASPTVAEGELALEFFVASTREKREPDARVVAPAMTLDGPSVRYLFSRLGEKATRRKYDALLAELVRPERLSNRLVV